jgi:LEA14-like dessication related protein
MRSRAELTSSPSAADPQRRAAIALPFALLALVLLALGAGGCALFGVETPRVSLVGIDLERVSLFESTLLVELRVDNPNAFRLPLERGVYTFYLDGERVGSGETRMPVDVPARSSRLQDVEIRLDNRRLLSRLTALLEREVAYRIDAEHYVRGLGGRALRSSDTGAVDLREALGRDVTRERPIR